MTGPCQGCGAFKAECIQPGGEDDAGEVELCWFCAHLVADHELSLAEVKGIPLCDCPREDIYPLEFRERVDAQLKDLDDKFRVERPMLWRGLIRTQGKPQ